MNDKIIENVSINSFEADLEVDFKEKSSGGRSPYIGDNGNWYEFDDATNSYIDTGVKAQGEQGQPGTPGRDYILTNEDKEDIANIIDAEAVKYVSQSLTGAQKEQARANIGAASLSDLGVVFTLKGGVATVQDLPQTNNRIGDVYYVENISAGFIWITSSAYPGGYWEELGETVDLSNYIEKPNNPVTGQFLQWNGTTWAAAALPLYNGGVS